MAEEVREQLSYQLDSIEFKLEDIGKTAKDLGIKLWHGDAEWAEDADIILEELDNSLGDVLDKFTELSRLVVNL